MVSVRCAKQSDLRDIVVMARRLAASVADPVPKISQSSLAGVLFGRSRWAECFVAVERGNTVGYAIISRVFEAHTGKRQLRIADLFVHEAARGSGVARQLLARIQDRARQLRCREVVWEVWKENRLAYSFYEHIGARHVGDISTMCLDV